jgi:hypothetical protein
MMRRVVLMCGKPKARRKPRRGAAVFLRGANLSAAAATHTRVFRLGSISIERKANRK